MMPNNSRDINVAFVGCGGVAQRYLSVYKNLDWVKVTTCIDSDLQIANQAAQTLQTAYDPTHIVATTDFTTALNKDIDLVVINTPNYLHREQAIAALQAGKDLFLQKPVAESISSAEEIARVAKTSTGTSGLYMSYFDYPLVHDLRDMVTDGWFGDIVHMYARLMHRGGMDWSNRALAGNPTWRGSIKQTGGGCFIQLAVHYIHLFQWLTGSRVERVSAVAKNLHCPGLEGEDICSAILEFNSGAIATLDMAWSTSSEELSIHGTQGSVDYCNNRLLTLWSNAGKFNGRVIHYNPDNKDSSQSHIASGETLEIIPPEMGDYKNPFNQHRLFLEALRDKLPPFVSIDSGVDDLRVIFAVYESARTNRAISL
jgi:predicted dehydrogenase